MRLRVNRRSSNNRDLINLSVNTEHLTVSDVLIPPFALAAVL